MEWIADRFFKTHEGWVDAATGHLVRLYISAPDRATDFDWNDQCARLANLRHPLLNPLVDYGLAATHRVEAYAAGTPVHLPTAAAPAAMEHAAAFVRASGVALEPGTCSLAIRSTAHGNRRNVPVRERSAERCSRARPLPLSKTSSMPCRRPVRRWSTYAARRARGCGRCGSSSHVRRGCEGSRPYRPARSNGIRRSFATSSIGTCACWTTQTRRRACRRDWRT